MKASKDEQVFMTWDDWCFEGLRKLGKATLKGWANEMNLTHPGSLTGVIKRLGDRIKITESKFRRLKFYEVNK